jgi:hypothetical protein
MIISVNENSFHEMLLLDNNIFFKHVRYINFNKILKNTLKELHYFIKKT